MRSRSLCGLGGAQSIVQAALFSFFLVLDRESLRSSSQFLDLGVVDAAPPLYMSGMLGSGPTGLGARKSAWDMSPTGCLASGWGGM